MKIHSLTKPALQSTILASLLAATMVYGQPAADSMSKDSQATKASSGMTTQGQKSSSAGTVSKEDQKFMRQLAHANISEIETAKLAQSKSQDEQVKKFAQQMIDDHTKATQELQQLAQSKGVELPNKPDKKHLALAKKMNEMPAEKFDASYVRHAGLADHKKTLNLLKKIQADAKEPELKALAGKMVPTVEQHHQMAQQLQTEKSKNKS